MYILKKQNIVASMKSKEKSLKLGVKINNQIKGKLTSDKKIIGFDFFCFCFLIPSSVDYSNINCYTNVRL